MTPKEIEDVLENLDDYAGQGCDASGGAAVIRWLQQELNEVRTKALAAVWLLPEGVGIRELEELHIEARSVFMGKDKQTIAKLQDELRYAQEAYQHAVRPPQPGVNAVYGIDSKDPTIRYAIMITRLSRAPNGGLDIEVQLP